MKKKLTHVQYKQMDALIPGHEIKEHQEKQLSTTTKTNEQAAAVIRDYKKGLVWPSNYITCKDANDLGRLAREISSCRYMAIDCETSGLHAWNGDLYCLSVWAGDTGFLVNFRHPLLPQFTFENVRLALSSYMEDNTITKYGFNLPFDAHFLEQKAGFKANYLHFDAYIASWLLFDDLLKGQRGLKPLCDRFLGETGPTYASLFGNKAWIATDPQVAAAYAIGDAEKHYKLSKFMQKGLEHTPSLNKLMYDLEMPFMNILYRTERLGLDVDENYIRKELGPRLTNVLEQLIGAMRELGLPESVDPMSPQQMAPFFFDTLKLPRIKGNSTDKFVLEALEDKHPIIKIFQEFRETSKLKNSFVDNLDTMMVNSKIHPSFSGIGTVTGRPSCSRPNLLNQPTKTGPIIRKAFIAPPGFTLVSKDLKGQELRIMAHFAKGKKLKDAILHGDIYSEVAATYYGGSPLDYTKNGPLKDNRQTGKVAFLALGYGAQEHKLSQVFGCSKERALEFLDDLFARFPELERLQQDCIAFAQENNCIWTELGRRRTLNFAAPDLLWKQKKELERQASNSPMQGTASDQIKLAILLCDKFLTENNYQSRVLFQIYDEILFLVKDEEWFDTSLSEDLDYIIINALPMDVPFETETEVYLKGVDGISRWGMTKKDD